MKLELVLPVIDNTMDVGCGMPSTASTTLSADITVLTIICIVKFAKVSEFLLALIALLRNKVVANVIQTKC